jgi:hypothetical protein
VTSLLFYVGCSSTNTKAVPLRFDEFTKSSFNGRFIFQIKNLSCTNLRCISHDCKNLTESKVSTLKDLPVYKCEDSKGQVVYFTIISEKARFISSSPNASVRRLLSGLKILNFQEDSSNDTKQRGLSKFKALAMLPSIRSLDSKSSSETDATIPEKNSVSSISKENIANMVIFTGITKGCSLDIVVWAYTNLTTPPDESNSPHQLKSSKISLESSTTTMPNGDNTLNSLPLSQDLDDTAEKIVADIKRYLPNFSKDKIRCSP